jgi:uncharacterized protein YbjT (DUF2867 family)
MSGHTAVIVGATGLIGKEIVQRLLDDPGFSTVRVLVRHWNGPLHAKLQVITVDFNDLQQLRDSMGTGDALFCAVGTTRSKVKNDLVEYRKVDVDIPINVARIGAAKGFRKFMLVSAVGANSKSGNFYLRFKGEVEEAVSKLQYQAIHIFRPSLLVGERSEKRMGERVGKIISQLIGFLLVGGLSRYKAVKGADVAQAMINAWKSPAQGVHIYHYDDIMRLV